MKKHKLRASSAPAGQELIEGELQLRGRYGFVLAESPGRGDVYVTGPSLAQAMHGDRVQVRIIPGRRREGVIINVVKRARSTAVGVLRTRDGLTVIIPEDESLAPIRVLSFNGLIVKEGQAAVVRITQWPHGYHLAGGEIIEVLGSPDMPGVDLRMILRREELPDSFPEDVLKESENITKESVMARRQKRKTFFHVPVFTIDGPDAKDFDDAVSLENVDDRVMRLGVHIADVSEYVRLGSALDREAAARGTSIYPSGSVIPMLPSALSENICSLQPGVERLTMSCLIDIDEHGDVKKIDIVEGVIKSVRRFTYEEAQRVLDAKSPGDGDATERILLEMGRLSSVLRKKRLKRGALDFHMPESKVVLDKNGKPTGIIVLKRLESHKLIEEFMLLANEAVAGYLAGNRRNAMYRVHGKPDKEKLRKAAETLNVFAIPAPKGFTEGAHQAFAEVLCSLHRKPFRDILTRLILRTLQQAVYSVKNEGHFGLASRLYTHFTSPIRRYPDLCVHRILKHVLKKMDDPQFAVWEKSLPSVAMHSSRRERQAQDAEYEYEKLKKVQFMKDKEGDVFKGMISSIVSFGFFVELDTYQVEGLVHVESLEDDYYIFDENKMSLHGRKTNRLFRPGQAVTVQLVLANVAKRQLDFQLIKS